MSSIHSGAGGGRSALSALGARISRALSRDGSSTFVGDEDRSSVKSGFGSSSISASPASTKIMSDAQSPSPSRGRELFSTGRGGAGNIHRSLSRDAPPVPAVPAPRGREPAVGTDVTHVGRGGVGNVRSPSRPRDPSLDAKQANYEHSLIERHDEGPHAFSTGRGGAGNIRTPEHSRSRSREPSIEQSRSRERAPSRGRVPHPTGRGGAGNIGAGVGADAVPFSALVEEDDAERRAYALARAQAQAQGQGQGQTQAVHSTGRGGRANVTALPSPPPEAHTTGNGNGGADGGVFSMGRGGAGNIRDRSASRGPGLSGSRERERLGHGPSALGKIFDRVKGHGNEGEKPQLTREVSLGEYK
ncbi:hypothetical protein M0805_000006 [Coniferiporia weirii]|nr:hypothetical protein M0805_000006 [Coniferiporia weirii]